MSIPKRSDHHAAAVRVGVARTVIDVLSAFVGLLDLDGTVLEVNLAALKIAGLTAGDVIGRPLWDCYWWTWSEPEQRLLRDAIARAAGGEPATFDAEIRITDDDHRILDFQVVPLLDAAGSVSRLVPSGSDITGMRDDEDALESLFTGAPIGFAQLDRDLRFVRLNPELATLNGRPADAHIGKTPMEMFPDLPQDDYLPAFRRALDGVPTEYELRGSVTGGGGERWWLERVYPLLDRRDTITGVGVFIVDITDRKRAQHERERQIGELQRSLLPRRIPHVDGLRTATRYRAADRAIEVGGDFYEVLAGPRFGAAAIIGDVCGRGAEAGARTALTRYTLTPLIERGGPSAAQSLQELNRILVEHHEPSTRFITVALALLRRDGTGFEATVALAGHPPPVLVRTNGSTALVGEPGDLVGIFPRTRAVDVTVELRTGDALVLYTDGYSEARNPHGDLFGDEGIRRALAPHAGGDPDELASALDSAVAGFTEGASEGDDRALLVISVVDRPGTPHRGAT